MADARPEDGFHLRESAIDSAGKLLAIFHHRLAGAGLPIFGRLLRIYHYGSKWQSRVSKAYYEQLKKATLVSTVAQQDLEAFGVRYLESLFTRLFTYSCLSEPIGRRPRVTEGRRSLRLRRNADLCQEFGAPPIISE